MSTNACRTRCRAIALGGAALLLATMVIAPAVAAAGQDVAGQRTVKGLLLSVKDAEIVLHRSAQPDLRLTIDGSTNVAMNGRNASVSDLREGEEVRASYQETDGVARAIRIDAQGRAPTTAVQTMSPDDPEWDQAHVGG
jgi:hypothetical protein